MACFSVKSSSASTIWSAIFLISITDISSDAESHEEQDGCNHISVASTLHEAHVHEYHLVNLTKQKQPGCKKVQSQSEATMVISDQKI